MTHCVIMITMFFFFWVITTSMIFWQATNHYLGHLWKSKSTLRCSSRSERKELKMNHTATSISGELIHCTSSSL